MDFSGVRAKESLDATQVRQARQSVANETADIPA